MSGKFPNAVITGARALCLLGSAIAMLTVTGAAAAESLSARVRACAAEGDSLRRLVCYDKNVAPFADAAAAAADTPRP